MANENFLFTTAVEIEASPDLVYRFFTEPELIKRWHGVDAECDANPGGIFLLNVTGVDFKIGEFGELDPQHRLVFTWGHPEGVDNFPPGSSVVDIRPESIATGTRGQIHGASRRVLEPMSEPFPARSQSSHLIPHC